jgi:hypothetical protein
MKMPRLFSLIASSLATLLLSACGGGGCPPSDNYPDIPHGIPVVVGGFVNWTDVQTTPDSTIGIVNGTGNPIVSVTFTSTDGDESFATYIAPGSLWSSGVDALPGFYLVSAVAADGRIFKRYFMYDPSIGSEAAVVSNANWDIDL